MTWATARRAVDFSLAETLSRATLRQRQPITQLGFFGGEPLLEWGLLQRATGYAEEECARLDIILSKTVTTNMSLLDGRKAEWLKARRFHIGLSLDGTVDRHDLLRRMVDGEPSQSKCAEALRYFRGPQANCVVILVVDPLNVTGLADSVAWLVEQEIYAFILNPNYNAQWSDVALAQWEVETHRVGDLYQQGFRAGRPIRVDVFDSKIEAHIANPLSRCESCGSGGAEIAIGPDGTIYPCVRTVGNLDRTGMEIGDVFTGFDLKMMRRLAPGGEGAVGECQGCAARARCKNWCACVNHATTGSVNRVSGLVCYHERMVIETADAIAKELFAERNQAFLSRFYQ